MLCACRTSRSRFFPSSRTCMDAHRTVSRMEKAAWHSASGLQMAAWHSASRMEKAASTIRAIPVSAAGLAWLHLPLPADWSQLHGSFLVSPSCVRVEQQWPYPFMNGICVAVSLRVDQHVLYPTVVAGQPGPRMAGSTGWCAVAALLGVSPCTVSGANALVHQHGRWAELHSALLLE
jgi:hypothetical protein